MAAAKSLRTLSNRLVAPTTAMYSGGRPCNGYGIRPWPLLASTGSRFKRAGVKNGVVMRNAGDTPNGIRTRVTALKGRGPRPLADGGAGAGYRSGCVVRPCRKAFQRRLEVVPGLGLRLGVVRSIHVAGQLEIPLPGGFSRERKDGCVLAGGHVLGIRSPGGDSSH